MRLDRWNAQSDSEAAVVCGLAGSLVPDLRPGDIFIPNAVAMPDSDPRPCDPALVESLMQAARSFGFVPQTGLLLTSPELVTGSDREHWAGRGFLAADMETALIPEHLRIATIRVILDAPGRSISSEWTSPARAVLRRHVWSELLWLARLAPAFAFRASRIADAGLRCFGEQPSQ